MASHPSLTKWSTGLFGLIALGGTAQAQFVNNTADIPSGSPGNNSKTENVDFGDVDLDGDWDAVFADGADSDQDQNRIWINGGPGANLGKFTDQTSTRFPVMNDQSRDIEFVDFDNDSDIDLYISNTAAIVAQGNRWWRNTGVGNGTYVDETSTRFVGLNSANSSIAASQLIGGGTFIDFSCDCDFGDVDNDGDMDLFHASYGGVFGGQVPSRIFLNDGAGFFTEFNPSGFKLAGQTIQAGNPGIWCQGTQQSNTTNATGVFCDIASSALDIDFGDVDGDFDLDVLHGARQEVPRMFRNLLSDTGSLAFRDVSAITFPAGYSSGNGHYEQEMGDLDGDGDLDIYGLNWQVSGGFNDITLRNDGAGTYSNLVVLAGSSSDDNEGDFLDYDNDGDLDLFVANFSGQDKLYRNNNNGGATFSFTKVTFPTSTNTALDADACDVDSDGDYDLFVANDFNAANRYFENTTQTPDTHAPYLPNVEQAPNRAPSAVPTVVRVQVYDNAPYYITWYNPTTLTYTVNGGGGTTIPARSSGGQIFRAEIPGNLVGTIAYFFTSQDEYGNTGMSATKNFVSSAGGANSGALGCDCSGGNPSCANSSPVGSGCPNTFGSGAVLVGSGNAAVGAGDTFSLMVTGGAPNNFGLILSGTAQIGPVYTVPNSAGGLCSGGTTLRSNVYQLNGSGTVSMPTFDTSIGGGKYGAAAGVGFETYQFWYRDPGGAAGCSTDVAGSDFNFTNGWNVTWL